MTRSIYRHVTCFEDTSDLLECLAIAGFLIWIAYVKMIPLV